MAKTIVRFDTNHPSSFRDQAVLNVINIVQGKIARKFIGYPLGNQPIRALSPQSELNASTHYQQKVSNAKI